MKISNRRKKAAPSVNLAEPRWNRRAKLVEDSIERAALRPPVESETLAHAGGRALAVWNSHADMIDARFGRDFLGVRLSPRNALVFDIKYREIQEPGPTKLFVPLSTAKRKAPESEYRGVPVAIWRAMAMLDDLAGRPEIFPDAQPGVFDWMADLLFMAIIPEDVIKDHASRGGGIFDSRLRKRKTVQATKQLLSLQQDLLEQKQVG